MTFDLAVWHSPRALSSEEAQEIYQALCFDETPPELKPNDRVMAFKSEFYGAHPPIDSESEAEDSLSPEDYDTREHGVVLNFGWSGAGRALESVTHLAAKHGLICYDPQERVVHHPPGLQSRPKPWWKFW